MERAPCNAQPPAELVQSHDHYTHNRCGWEALHMQPDLKRNATEQLLYCRTMPTLPSVAFRLIRLADDDKSDVNAFAALIRNDAALTKKLLRVANSALYWLPRRVASLSQAVNLLGQNATVSLALGFTIRRAFTGINTLRPDLDRYWRRSILTALAGHTLANDLKACTPEDAWLTGLVRDIGILAMINVYGQACRPAQGESETADEVLAHERAAYGTDYVHGGLAMLRGWQFPERLCWAIGLSHETIACRWANKRQRFPLCVAAAAVLANAWIDGATPQNLRHAHDGVHALVNIDTQSFARVVADMGGAIPEIEELFEVPIVDSHQIRDAESSACELLMARNLTLVRAA